MRERAGSKAIAWLDREFPSFDLGQTGEGMAPDEATQTAFGEVAWLTLVLSREGRCAGEGHMVRWLEHIADAYQQPGFCGYVFTGHPLAFTGHLVLWLAVSSHTNNVPVARAALQQLINSGRVTSVERPPYRMIELRYFLDLGGFRHDLPPYCSLFDQCFLAALPVRPGDTTEEDLYAATHALFYLTDFGAAQPDFLAADRVGRIEEFLAWSLHRMVEVHHWDLVAELLASLQCLRSRETPALVWGWRALAEAQDDSGAILEGPRGDRLVLARDAELSRGQFLSLYHRSIVTALAAYVGRF